MQLVHHNKPSHSCLDIENWFRHGSRHSRVCRQQEVDQVWRATRTLRFVEKNFNRRRVLVSGRFVAGIVIYSSLGILTHKRKTEMSDGANTLASRACDGAVQLVLRQRLLLKGEF